MTRAVALLAILVTAACARAPEPGALPCGVDSACPAGYHCGIAGRCVGDVDCAADADCCLGQQCRQGRCRARQMCSQPAPCGEPGTKCVQGLCLPSDCQNDADCPTNRRCRLGTCRKHLPCAGSCPTGSACAAHVDRCVALRQPTGCPAGALAVLSNDVAHLAEGCADVPQLVACRKLPPIAYGEYGRPARVVRVGERLAVIARDRTYGDLLVATHQVAPPHARIRRETIAGVPTDAPIVGDPTGPRGGIAAPGPDVGRLLVAHVGAVDGVHVVFSDDTAGTLRYLSLAPDLGVTRRHTLQTGRFSGLAVGQDSQGRPLIVGHEEPVGGSGAAGTRKVWLLRGTAPGPAKTDDWQPTVLLTADLPQRPSSPLGAAVARGIGVHLSVGAAGSSPRVAAYDSVAGELVVLSGGVDGETLAVRRLKGASVAGGSTDVGRFASLGVRSDGRLRIACQDASAGRLLLVDEDKVGGLLVAAVIDDGVRADGHHRVGADCQLAMTADDGVVIAYQDTRKTELVVTRVTAAGKTVTPIALPSTAAAGFSAGVVVLSGKALVVGSAELVFAATGDLAAQYVLRPVVLGAQ